MKPIRKISIVEQLYEDVQSVTNTYAIHYIFKITGFKKNDIVENAINEVIKKCPGTNIYLKRGYFYPQNNPIRIKRVNLSCKEIFDASFMQKSIDLSDHSIEVYLASMRKDRYLVFRFAHSVLDGKGTLLFVQNVVNVLNKKQIINCDNNIDEKAFIKKLNYYKKNEPKLPKIPHHEARPINNYKVKWRLIQIDEYVPAIVAKLSSILAQEFECDTTRMMIPVDLRRHDKSASHIGNLTLPIFLNVKKTDDYKAINGEMLYALKNKKELNLSNTLPSVYRHIPGKIRKTIAKTSCKAISRYNKFSIGALISHLGRVNFDDYANSYFTVKDFVSLPVQQPLGAFSIVILEHSGKTNIAFSYYKDQFNNQYINNLLDRIKQNLLHDMDIIKGVTVNRNENYIDILANNLHRFKSYTAVVDGDQTYTYGDLLKNIEKFNGLFSQKQIHGTLIIYLERSFDYLSAVLTCVFNNIVFVPVDKTTSLSRLNQIIEESQAHFVLSESALDVSAKTILASEKRDIRSKRIDPKYDETKEVYDIYTSGTTGIPKCIPISNKNLNNYLLWGKSEYQTLKPMTVPLFTSLSVDLTITATFLPLLCGGTIKVFKEAFNQNTLKQIFADRDINFVKLTPTHLSFFTDSKIKDDKKECIVIGGEELPIQCCKNLHQSFKKAKIYNEYGPAETTIGTIYHVYNPEKDQEYVPIGKPINNTAVVLYNDSSETQPNHTGEILISGDSVFGGYKNTNKNPFTTINKTQYYRTGDYGYLENNAIVYSGRKDSQIKIHGYRTELGEIKHTIMEQRTVKDAVVATHENELYAFVRMYDGHRMNKKQIVDLISSKLSSRCVPDYIIETDEFPINNNGKVDKQKLFEMAQESADKTTSASRQHGLLKILNEVKKLDSPSYDVSIIELGLDSFEVVSFIQKCQKAYIQEKNEEAFTSEVFKRIGTITLRDLEKIIIDFGGKPK